MGKSLMRLLAADGGRRRRATARKNSGGVVSLGHGLGARRLGFLRENGYGRAVVIKGGKFGSLNTHVKIRLREIQPEGSFQMSNPFLFLFLNSNSNF
jgi:hypothetical protein